MLLDDRQHRRCGVAGVSAKVFASPFGWLRSLDYDDIKHGFELGYVMPAGSGHDERQRDATTVDQQMALAPIFSPGPLDWVQQLIAPWVLSSLRRQCFAIARRCLQSHRTRQARSSINPQKPLPSPTPKIWHESRWHCQTAQRGVPSTGSLYATHKQWPQRQAGDLWACVRHRPCGRSFDLPSVGVLESAALHASRIHRSRPMIWLLPSSLQTRSSRMERD
jgi:hypothetical protein